MLTIKYGGNMNESKKVLKAWRNDTLSLFIFLFIAIIFIVGVSVYLIFPDRFFWNMPHAVEIEQNPAFIKWQDAQAVYELTGTMRGIDRNVMGVIIVAKPKGDNFLTLQVDGYPNKVTCKFIKADWRNAWNTTIYIGNRDDKLNQNTFEIYAIATSQSEANHLLDVETKIAGAIPKFENRKIIEQLLRNQVWSKKLTIDFPNSK